jgi:hypothetical protein
MRKIGENMKSQLKLLLVTAMILLPASVVQAMGMRPSRTYQFYSEATSVKFIYPPTTNVQFSSFGTSFGVYGRYTEDWEAGTARLTAELYGQARISVVQPGGAVVEYRPDIDLIIQGGRPLRLRMSGISGTVPSRGLVQYNGRIIDINPPVTVETRNGETFFRFRTMLIPELGMELEYESQMKGKRAIVTIP